MVIDPTWISAGASFFGKALSGSSPSRADASGYQDTSGWNVSLGSGSVASGGAWPVMLMAIGVVLLAVALMRKGGE